MDKEQAIQKFQEKIDWANQNRYPYVSESDVELYKMAINALAISSAEPCEDAISRQVVLSYIYNDLGLGDEENGADIERQKELESSYRYVKSLSPVKLPSMAIPPAEPKIVPIANIHFDEDKMREVCKEVAENIVVEYDFKGKTNGEVIKMLFPNIDNYFSNVIDLRLWWNSPYETQESEERTDGR